MQKTSEFVLEAHRLCLRASYTEQQFICKRVTGRKFNVITRYICWLNRRLDLLLGWTLSLVYDRPRMATPHVLNFKAACHIIFVFDGLSWVGMRLAWDVVVVIRGAELASCWQWKNKTSIRFTHWLGHMKRLTLDSFINCHPQLLQERAYFIHFVTHRLPCAWLHPVCSHILRIQTEICQRNYDPHSEIWNCYYFGMDGEQPVSSAATPPDYPGWPGWMGLSSQTP